MKKTIKVQETLERIEKEAKELYAQRNQYKNELYLSRDYNKQKEINEYILCLNKIILGLEKAYDIICDLSDSQSKMNYYV